MLILASTSPRRKELISLLGLPFICKSPECDESSDITLPQELVKELSLRKAMAVEINNGDILISADTVVALGDRILGKPRDQKEAYEMLGALSGNTHHVYTGYCIRTTEKTYVDYTATEVVFGEIRENELLSYIKSGEPLDKAGSYGIQGKGGLFVKEIKGDYNNVVGLPVYDIANALRDEFHVELFENT